MPTVTVSVEFPESLQRDLLAHAPEGPQGQRLADDVYFKSWLQAAVCRAIALAVADRALASLIITDFAQANGATHALLITAPWHPRRPGGRVVMALGPGKYGARAEALLREVGGAVCVVITIDGDKGSAFDVATTDPRHLALLPSVLRRMAKSIDRDLHSGDALRRM